MKPPPFRQQQMLAQAQQLHGRGDAAGAAELYRQLLKSDPANPRLLYLLGAAELGLGWTGEARGHFQEALRKAPGDVGAWHDLALTFKRDGRFAEALAALDRALALKPDDVTLRAAKAGVHQMIGDHAAAGDVLAPALGADPPHIAVALVFARIASRLGRGPEAIELLERCLAKPGLPPTVHADALFHLGNVHDSAGDFDAAFGAYREANSLRAGRYNADTHSRGVDELIKNWTPAAVAALARGRAASERCVFIVGMPRSGTSLVEQILATHPSVFGAGELDDVNRAVFNLAGPGPGGVPLLISPALLTRAAVERIEREYLDHLRRLAPSASRITDKMPANFLHLGVIAAAFPRAQIIHCIRDARDTCLSCYVQNFGGNQPYSFDLKDLGRFYRDYRRTMAHWRSVLPLKIHDVVYEDLVADTERVSRGMLEFIGLAWDPACLRFHESSRIVRTASNEQVRRPVYTGSVQRWRRYEQHLGPLLESLGDLT